MRQIQLTKGFMAIVDDADFERVNQHNWQVNIQRRKDGTIRGIYAQRSIGKRGSRKIQMMHRFILEAPPDCHVDHEDRDGLNNRRLNLRKSERWQNSGNSVKRRNNTSGHKGVSWHKRLGKWEAKIMVKGSRRSLGMFAELADAATAYKNAAKELLGEFARV